MGTEVNALELIGYDPETKTFPSTVYSNFSPIPLPYEWGLDDNTLRISVSYGELDATFEGTFSEDGKSFQGGWRPNPGADEAVNVPYDIGGHRVKRSGEVESVIARLWRGWTTTANADKYQELLSQEILPGIEAKARGYRGVFVLRRDDGERVEFVTLTLWDSLDAIRTLVGDDYEVAYIPVKAKKALASYDERSLHYELALSLLLS
jgi:heme-degrading monooxygenase HmoA